MTMTNPLASSLWFFDSLGPHSLQCQGEQEQVRWVYIGVRTYIPCSKGEKALTKPQKALTAAVILPHSSCGAG